MPIFRKRKFGSAFRTSRTFRRRKTFKRRRAFKITRNNRKRLFRNRRNKFRSRFPKRRFFRAKRRTAFAGAITNALAPPNYLNHEFLDRVALTTTGASLTGIATQFYIGKEATNSNVATLSKSLPGINFLLAMQAIVLSKLNPNTATTSLQMSSNNMDFQLIVNKMRQRYIIKNNHNGPLRYVAYRCMVRRDIPYTQIQDFLALLNEGIFVQSNANTVTNVISNSTEPTQSISFVENVKILRRFPRRGDIRLNGGVSKQYQITSTRPHIYKMHKYCLFNTNSQSWIPFWSGFSSSGLTTPNINTSFLRGSRFYMFKIMGEVASDATTASTLGTTTPSCLISCDESYEFRVPMVSAADYYQAGANGFNGTAQPNVIIPQTGVAIADTEA